VAGKTGTGDQRLQVYGPGGRLIASRSVARSATFVFTLGERYFGTVTVHAREPYAARYSFTSALAVRVLRYLAPQVTAMATPGSEQALLRCRDSQPEASLPRATRGIVPLPAIDTVTVRQAARSKADQSLDLAPAGSDSDRGRSRAAIPIRSKWPLIAYRPRSL
jgi:hypothetical protein